jgi:hypothetical protein
MSEMKRAGHVQRDVTSPSCRSISDVRRRTCNIPAALVSALRYFVRNDNASFEVFTAVMIRGLLCCDAV